MTTIAEIKKNGKCALEYNRADREWLLGRPDGKILAFPAGQEGKLAAQMSALTHDVPEAAAQIDALMQAYPDSLALHRRAIKAGFIIRDGLITERLPLDHFRIRSQRHEDEAYLVSLDHNNCHCQCADWQHTHFDLDRKADAPHVPGLGLACKHVLAAWIVAKIEPLAECPKCNGESFFKFWNDDVGVWQAEECDLCSGAGEVPQEWTEPLLEPGPMPESAPMSYEDLPLSDAEYHDLQELRDEEIPF